MFRILLIIGVFVIGFVCGAQYKTLDKVPGLSWVGDKADVLQKIPLPPPEETPAETSSAASVPDLPKSSLKSSLNLYAVQVGSFRSKDQADKLIADLHKEQINAYVSRADLENNTGWYRVYIGEYADRSDAEAKLAGLKSRYAQAFVQRVE